MNHPPASAFDFCLETVRSGRQWLMVFSGAITAMAGVIAVMGGYIATLHRKKVKAIKGGQDAY